MISYERLLLIIFLLTHIFAAAILLILGCILARRAKKLRGIHIAVTITGCLLAVAAAVWLHPFERQLHPQLIAEIAVSEDAYPEGVMHENWNTVYGKYGLQNGSWMHPHEKYQLADPDAWPTMDTGKYTYIVTFGREIESLSYWNWLMNTAPLYAGEHEGKMVFSEEHDPYTIYVYRIPRMRITNPDLW